MGFMDSYKHLEKLCGEILNDERRVTAYIDEMERLPRGTYLVKGWNDDLKKLKHYRWVRNQIAHEPNCSEDNMCDIEDTQWLDDFYMRILNQTDPLALYCKATQAHSASEPHKSVKKEKVQMLNNYKQSSKRTVGYISLGMCTVLVIAIILVLLIC